MTDTTYVMTVRIEQGRYSEREVLFNVARYILITPGAMFEILDTEDEHELDVYGVPNHDALLVLLSRLIAAVSSYRKRYPESPAQMIIGAYAERPEEGVEDSHPIGCPCTLCPA